MAKPAYDIRKLEPSNFDSRLIERHLGEGRISAKELQTHLDGLEDMSDNAEEFKVLLGEDPDADDDAKSDG